MFVTHGRIYAHQTRRRGRGVNAPKRPRTPPRRDQEAFVDLQHRQYDCPSLTMRLHFPTIKNIISSASQFSLLASNWLHKSRPLRVRNVAVSHSVIFTLIYQFIKIH